MPTIKVDGDLEDALRRFKQASTGPVSEYQQRQAFSSPAEQRRKAEHLAELKRRSKERRKRQRQEENRQAGRRAW